MLSRQGGLNLEIKCPCARKTWHEREVGVFLKWTYFRQTTVILNFVLFSNFSEIAITLSLVSICR